MSVERTTNDKTVWNDDRGLAVLASVEMTVKLSTESPAGKRENTVDASGSQAHGPVVPTSPPVKNRRYGLNCSGDLLVNEDRRDECTVDGLPSGNPKLEDVAYAEKCD